MNKTLIRTPLSVVSFCLFGIFVLFFFLLSPSPSHSFSAGKPMSFQTPPEVWNSLLKVRKAKGKGEIPEMTVSHSKSVIFRAPRNYSLVLFVTSADNMVHVLYYEGDTIVEVANYTNTLQSKNFASCPATTTKCNPPQMVFSNDRLIVPGNITTYFAVTITCPTGYNLSVQNSCNDIDECFLMTHNCSKSPIRPCLNTNGSYTCGDCPDGYENDGLYECKDIDECKNGTHKCSIDPLRVCMNGNGTYSCGPCPAGYIANGPLNCDEINECNTTTTHNCSKSPVRPCLNTPGNYTCGDCPTGYQNSGPFNCLANNVTSTGATGSQTTITATGSQTTTITATGSQTTITATGSQTTTITATGSQTTVKTNTGSSGAMGMLIASLFVAVVILI